jgi:epoxyqueuosine reductase
LPIDQLLLQKGFTLQAALEVSAVEIRLPEVAGDYNQLLVFGHAGSGFWKSLDEPVTGSDPLDSVSIKMVEDFLQRIGCADYLVLYPSTDLQIDLRALGKQLGWHADSALGIGINTIHGTWFAYRVAVLANTSYETPANNLAESSCTSCINKPCVEACPVDAPGVTFDLQACMAERVREGSACAYQCLARNACPVGTEYRYDQDQMRYHYQKSLQLIQSNELT